MPDGTSINVGHSTSKNVARLRAYAESRGLEVVTSEGTQREPEHMVVIRTPGSTSIIKRASLDSVDTAAGYLINTLELLGVDLGARRAGHGPGHSGQKNEPTGDRR